MPDAKTGYLSRDEILDAEDREYRDVDVPEWGGRVRVASLGAAARVEFLGRIGAGVPAGAAAAIARGEDPSDLGFGKIDAAAILREMPWVVAQAVVDGDGELLFSLEDVDRLSRRSFAALQRVFDAACEISGLAKKGVDDAGKGSSASTPGGSPSGSRGTSGSPGPDVSSLN